MSSDHYPSPEEKAEIYRLKRLLRTVDSSMELAAYMKTLGEENWRDIQLIVNHARATALDAPGLRAVQRLRFYYWFTRYMMKKTKRLEHIPDGMIRIAARSFLQYHGKQFGVGEADSRPSGQIAAEALEKLRRKPG